MNIQSNLKKEIISALNELAKKHNINLKKHCTNNEINIEKILNDLNEINAIPLHIQKSLKLLLT